MRVLVMLGKTNVAYRLHDRTGERQPFLDER